MAKDLLQEHFGNKHNITAAYMEKVLGWPVVKPEDIKSLQAYALILRECCNAMEDVQYIRELDMPANIKTVILKLPYKLRGKWRISACEILEKFNRRTQFIDIVSFIERQVKIVSDPIFGDIQNTQLCTLSKNVNRMKSQMKPRFKGDSFATIVTTIETPTREESRKSNQVQRQSSSSANNTSLGMCCSQVHTLEQCPQLEKKTHRNKINFMKEKGICFGCLRSGHGSKDCDKRLTCKVCSQNHPSMLHINQRGRAVNTDPKQPKEPSVSSALVSLQTCVIQELGTATGFYQTNAFLDPGSTATFCSENLMRKLNINGRKAQISLQTMGPKASVSSYMLTGLEISNLTGTMIYPVSTPRRGCL